MNNLSNNALMNVPPVWKENRQGAVSLCYHGLSAPEQEWVLAHHAAVGIRASIICEEAEPRLSVVAERNWDLLAGRDDALLRASLSELDGRTERGCFLPDRQAAVPPGTLYRLGTLEEPIRRPEPDLAKPLPSFSAPPDAGHLLDRTQRTLETGDWLILRLHGRCLTGMGPAAHQTLLHRLGDFHARIWCAPVRDIAQWKAG